MGIVIIRAQDKKGGETMAKYNFNFAKIKENGKLEYAQIPLLINGKNVWTNVAERYIEQGFYPIEHTDMPGKEGYYYTAFWAIENNKCLEKWAEHEEPVPEPMSEPDVLFDVKAATDEEIKNAIAEGVNSIDS